MIINLSLTCAHAGRLKELALTLKQDAGAGRPPAGEASAGPGDAARSGDPKTARFSSDGLFFFAGVRLTIQLQFEKEKYHLAVLTSESGR